MTSFLCCSDDDMQSLASMVTADNSFDVGNMSDIDGGESDDDGSQGISSMTESVSDVTISELTSQMEEAFGHDSSAHGSSVVQLI